MALTNAQNIYAMELLLAQNTMSNEEATKLKISIIPYNRPNRRIIQIC